MDLARRPPLLAGLPVPLQRLLDPSRGALLAPVRSEIFGAERFAQHGRSLGLTHAARRPPWAGASFFPRLRSNIRMLRWARQALLGQDGIGEDASPATQWLLDNFHLIDAQLQAIHEGLPRSYFRRLPVLQAAPLAGLPRIYGVAWAFIAHTDSHFDEDLLRSYLDAYQSTRDLRLAELWALPTTLRAVLVENLRRLAERLATQQAARELANRCCDQIGNLDGPRLQGLFDDLTRRGAGMAFLAQLGQRLQDPAGGSTGPVPAAVRGWLHGVLPHAASVQALQSAEQTADNLSVSNAVASLRAIGDADWPDLVMRSSPLMGRMLGSPLFAAEHHDTRDDTLHAIEALARRSHRSELQVAQALLNLMGSGEDTHADADTHTDRATAGHWLHGAGRPALDRALGRKPRARLPWPLSARRWVLPAYLLTLFLATAALVDAMLGGRWQVAALLLAWPASEAVIALLHRLISESTRPRRLPRLALASGIPTEHRVMVVIPGLLNNRETIEGLAHRLELHHLANPEAQAQFALLTDWVDADTQDTDRDDALLTAACGLITSLNERHAQPGDAPASPRFLLLHRRRRFSSSERRWIGWERKRGKLEQLVELLADPATAAGSAAFVDLGPLSTPAVHTRYVVTLDSDTQLPPGRLRALVGVAAHPANRPRVSADGRRVVSGYGILQPRLVTPLPLQREDTLFHRMFAGQPGIDPYSAASSEIYQDLFEEGSFTGKGLLDVQAMHAVLAGSVPEGQVLSHDLLEGALARCASVTDVTLIEDAPFHAEVAASRVHRWTRGDWQLLPILLRSLLRPARHPLGAVNRWKMIDNLRRSLVAPVSLLMLVLGLAGAAVLPQAAANHTMPLLLTLVTAAFVAGPLLGALAGLVASRIAVARLHFYRQAGLELLRAAGGGLWHVAMLLQHALLAVDAIVRALWRVLFSHRLLLQWTTAAAAHAAAGTDLAAALRRHWSLPLVALVLGATLWLVDTPYPVWSAGLCLLWGAAPLWTWLVSRAASPHARGCTPADAAYLHGVARDTWRYFERSVTATDHHLPPDNLQTRPHDMLARRTSPTNIGLYLLGAACARQFGWLGTPELVQRLQATLSTLEGLAGHRGHLFNWYDTASGEPLLPRYVSTVDSGNLSGHLLAVAQACLERARAPDEAAHAAALREIASRCQALAWRPDFGFLYHPRRHLLHIGYRVAEDQLDAGFYDLLASESRLTSLLAIAKGDVPVRHWAALGRPFHAVRAAAGLRSWSGSMFEYLMPTLMLAEPHGSVLHEACKAALVEQQAFARAQGVPWGISESAYAGQDHTLAYQYAPQGVPRLAMRRTPVDELVIAPYATALAAPLDAGAASRNLAALQDLGARSSMGFIDALDFTPSRQLGGQTMTLVHTVMAHHQGMTVAALANVLLDQPVQRWGMADPHIEAVASLLHERAPREVSRLHPRTTEPSRRSSSRPAPTLQRTVRPGRQAVEPTHLLSNGRYSVALRANGAGHSRHGSTDVTRWRDDALRDAHGSFFWLRRAGSAQAVSLTQHPAGDAHADYRAVFHADRVDLMADWPDLATQITVWVSPEDDVEFRRVHLSNRSDVALDIELISVFEPTLATARADEAHPAFGNLFVKAQADAPRQALWFERRPRLADEAGLHAVHFLADTTTAVHALRCQVDRQRWLGRNRAAWAPRGDLMTLGDGPDRSLPGLDTGLDPICVLAPRLVIAPGASASLCFATAAATDRHTLQSVVDKYRQRSHVERAALMSVTLASIRLRELGMGAETFTALQSLTTALMLTLSRPQGIPREPSTFDRRRLWRFAISGDRPVILVSVASLSGLNLVRALSQALDLWAWGGTACDLVVVNGEPASYDMALQRELATLRDRHDAHAHAVDRSGPSSTGWYLLRADELPADDLATLQAVARLRLQADGRSLAHHLADWLEQHETAARRRSAVGHARPATADPSTIEAEGSDGSFCEGGDFAFEVGTARRPSRPWINVLANPAFGTHVSEAGGGGTWAVNSRLNQLTPWSNDPVSDPPSEWLLLQDELTREVWSFTPSAHAAPTTTYSVRHGQGRSVVVHRIGALDVSVTWCVDVETSVKQVQLRITNHGLRTRRLRWLALCEWLLGAQRSDRAGVHTALHRQGSDDAGRLVLLATQQDGSAGFGGGTAFLATVDRPGDGSAAGTDWTCDRREWFDAGGRLVVPDQLGRASGGDADPCAALAQRLAVPPRGTSERVLLLGWADSPTHALDLARDAGRVDAAQRLRAALHGWETLLNATVVKTPDPLFDALTNHWLLYQAVVCRLWAKAGFYQAGGATGFRDQLQDAMALSWAEPDLLRQQILRAAARQFVEGDVQHWWHEPQGAGVRTHFSDDLLWLPYALAHHVQRTGDVALLDHRLPFLDGPGIPADAEDVFMTPTVGTEEATVYEHAARTIDRSLRVGVHGLPLMGSGDWNDGMNRVGRQGRGESVWLAWFLCRVVADFSPLARHRGDDQRAARWHDASRAWQEALTGPAWDGQWYARAFFDDGQPLGSASNAEARIDLIAQAWSVLSGVGTPARQAMALDAAQAHLEDERAGLIRLLDPPLADAVPNAGYIQAYPPGVRENGGQYSHAGVWALMAEAAHAKAQVDPAPGLDRAWRYFEHLSPAHRSAEPGQSDAYGIEPYVMAGDVCSAPPWVGRGGWSWYTGSAAWMHRAAIESICGLQMGATELRFVPGLPSHWPRVELTLRRADRHLHFLLLRVAVADALGATGSWAMGEPVTVLLPGQPLAWTAQPARAHFVVPLG